MKKEHISTARGRIRGVRPPSQPGEKKPLTDGAMPASPAQAPQQRHPSPQGGRGRPARRTQDGQHGGHAPRSHASFGGHRGGGMRGNKQAPQHESRGPKISSPAPAKTLRVIPIGGTEEVGRNMTVLEYEDNILIIDMGLQFPEEDMPGIDYIIPNIEYLKGREKDVAGVIITHAHYDHIGAIPHLIPKLGNPPIYGTDLTLAIIKKRHEEFKDTSCQLELHEVNKDSRIRIGIFDVEFFVVRQNIPASRG